MKLLVKMHPKRVSTIIAIGVIVAAFVTAISLSLTTSRYRPIPIEDDANVMKFAKKLADRETGFRDRSRRHFPGDVWSQDDDFHNMEQRWVRGVAKQNDFSVGELFYAIDKDIRSKRVPNRRSSASPCKPRPFYD